MCPKSSFALGRNVITENLTIVNCQVSGFQEGTLLDGTMKPSGGGTGRIKFGTEANGGFRNVTVANCTFRACHGLALEEVDGGIMENITINNITMMDVAGYPIYITTGKRNRGPDVTSRAGCGTFSFPTSSPPALTRRAAFRSPDSRTADRRRAAGKHPAHVQGRRHEGASRARAARNWAPVIPNPARSASCPPTDFLPGTSEDLELANISLSFETEDLRPAMVCVDVDGVEIDNFKAQLAPGVPAAKFDSVKNVVDPELADAGGNSASLKIFTPGFCALSSLEPASSPARYNNLFSCCRCRGPCRQSA